MFLRTKAIHEKYWIQEIIPENQVQNTFTSFEQAKLVPKRTGARLVYGFLKIYPKKYPESFLKILKTSKTGFFLI